MDDLGDLTELRLLAALATYRQDGAVLDPRAGVAGQRPGRGSARAAAFARCDHGGDDAPWNRLAAWQRPEPRRGLDDYAEPAAADIPAVGAYVDTGELIAAQLP